MTVPDLSADQFGGGYLRHAPTPLMNDDAVMLTAENGFAFGLSSAFLDKNIDAVAIRDTN